MGRPGDHDGRHRHHDPGPVRPLHITTSSVAGLSVASDGAITGSGTLLPGTYTVSGTDTDANGDNGTWSFTLHVTGT
jgi:hypothetical protein